VALRYIEGLLLYPISLILSPVSKITKQNLVVDYYFIPPCLCGMILGILFADSTLGAFDAAADSPA
jgi:hypothetical protein